ncbi:MAG: YHS domain protein [Candidatus Thiodiazotropha taylori]|nr:YHS domain protein [Candidatus Thiodiazotropha taylori]MCW4325795.1 YHS domain protein [Candidatus Thiodiazotropha taylori]
MFRSTFAYIFTILTTHLWAGVDTGTDANDVILAGYDVVAYHTQGEAVEGTTMYTAVYNDAIYQFSSADNRELFNSNPEKYAPAYGGFCAYGATLGKKFQVDGKAFEVVDGKLYVNKNQQVYDIWRKDIPGNLNKADAQWPKIVDTPADEL